MPLATNWRFTGNVYVCNKSGNDTNSGTQAFPFKTIGAAVAAITGGTIVVRSGYYNEGDIFKGNTFTMLADGYVIVDCQGFANGIRLDPSVGFSQSLWRGFTLLNWLSFANRARYEDCIIKNSVGLKLKPFDEITVSAKNSLVVNTDIEFADIAANTRRRACYRSTFINCSLTFQNIDAGDFYSIENSYFDGSSINNSDSPQFINCAFADGYTINGQSINTEFGTGDGIRYSGTNSIGGQNTVFNNCFWTATPNFNNPSREDYTLRDSPRSILWNNGNIIGNYNIGVQILPSDQAFDPANGATYTDINRNTVDEKFELIAPNVSGEFQSSLDPTKCLDLGELVTLDSPLLWFGLFPPLEVIQKTKYDALSPNPTVRLDWEINIYDESEPNGVNNTLNFIGFKRMEVNKAIETDASGLGNGNQDADLSALGSAIVRRFAIKCTLREDGN